MSPLNLMALPTRSSVLRRVGTSSCSSWGGPLEIRLPRSRCQARVLSFDLIESMNSLPSYVVANLVENIKRCDAWQDRAYEGFGLQRRMLDDIASLSSQGEDDLQSISSFFAESAKERLSAPGGKWSWRTRDSIASHKSPYLDWLN